MRKIFSRNIHKQVKLLSNFFRLIEQLFEKQICVRSRLNTINYVGEVDPRPRISHILLPSTGCRTWLRLGDPTVFGNTETVMRMRGMQEGTRSLGWILVANLRHRIRELFVEREFSSIGR